MLGLIIGLAVTFLCPHVPPGSAPCSHSSASLGHQQNPKSINKKATKTQPVCLSSLHCFQWCWRQELGISVASKLRHEAAALCMFE